MAHNLPRQSRPHADGAFHRLLISFDKPDFLKLWSFNVISSMGMSMGMIAQGWLVLDLTNSAFWVGAVAGVRGMGQLGFGAVGGAIGDRIDRRKILIAAQFLRAALLLMLALLIVADRLQIWHVMVVALIEGLIQSIVLPASGTLTYDIVGRQRLLNAVATQHAAFNIAKLAGSIPAGILIASQGVGACYFAIAGAYFLCPIPLLLIKTKYVSTRTRESLWRNTLGGVRYAAHDGTLRSLLLFSILIEAFGFSYQTMLPVIAKDVLEVGATGLGYLSAAGGLGALMGTMVLASLGDFKTKGLLLIITSSATGLGLVLFGLSPWYAASLVLAGIVGASLVAYDSILGTMLQLLAAEGMQSRVLGLLGLIYGFTSVGGFVIGAVAAASNAQVAVAMGGGIILTGMVSILLPMSSLRRPAEPVPRRTESHA